MYIWFGVNNDQDNYLLFGFKNNISCYLTMIVCLMNVLHDINYHRLEKITCIQLFIWWIIIMLTWTSCLSTTSHFNLECDLPQNNKNVFLPIIINLRL